MTSATREKYEATCSKWATVAMGIQLGSYAPIDLLSQPEALLLMLEGFERLTAVVVEGTLGEGSVCWQRVGQPPRVQ